MGVYIPKMKKPQYCGTCILCLDDSRICHGYCMIFHRKVNTMELDKDCPLVPVPTHGRLGDLDALKERVTKRLYSSNHGSMAEAYYAALIDLIDTAPTIIPASEKEE